MKNRSVGLMLCLTPPARVLSQLIEQLPARTEIGLLQTLERYGQLRKATLRRVGEHAQRPKDRDTESLAFFTRITVVHKPRIG
jgi:hypothetical protein